RYHMTPETREESPSVARSGVSRGGNSSFAAPHGMKALTSPIGQFLVVPAPIILLVWAFGICCFFYGYQVGFRHWFPASFLDDARVAQFVIRQKLGHSDRIRDLTGWTDISPVEGKDHRIVVKEAVNDG